MSNKRLRVKYYSQFKQSVEKRDYRLLTQVVDWKNQRTRVHFQCPVGHVFDMLPYDFGKGKIPCIRCSGYRTTLENVQEFAIQKGWRFLENFYNKDSEPYRWQCPNGHVQEATTRYFKKCQTCHECRKLTYTLMDFHRAARERGWSCITTTDKTYSGTSNLNFICNKGHHVKTNYSCLVKNQCKECGNVKQLAA